jgi:hypothetical protein
MNSATPQRQFRAAPAFEVIPALAGAFAVLVGVLVLIGWWRDIPALRTIFPGLVAMIPNTAVACIAAGAALVLTIRTDPGQRARGVSRGFAWVLTTLGLLFLFEHVTDIGLGIDLLLFGSAVGPTPLSPPGRPAINSAVVMIVDGAALLLIDADSRRGRQASEALSTLGVFIAFTAIVGYMYDVRGLYSFGSFPGMTLLTALTLGVLSLGILFARPNEGAVSLITSADPSGAMVRRLIPAALIVPIGLGALWLLARDANLMTDEAGVSAFVGAVVVTFLFIVLYTAAVVRSTDAERDELLMHAQEARAVAERAADKTERLRRTAEALSTALTPMAVARVIVSEGVPALGASASEVAILNPDGVVLELMAVSGLPAEVADAWRRFPVTSRVPLADAVRTTDSVLLTSPARVSAQGRDSAARSRRVT